MFVFCMAPQRGSEVTDFMGGGKKVTLENMSPRRTDSRKVAKFQQ
jgi:hypothetical protein